MPAPWEKYQTPAAPSGPWQSYGSTPDLVAPAPAVSARPISEALKSNPITNWTVAPVLDFLEGIGAGVLSTARGASQIAHKLAPAIPEVPESLAQAPPSLSGSAGKLAEQTAEFMVPAGAVSKATRGAHLLLRMGAEGLAAGSVAALQSGGQPGPTAAAAIAGTAGPAVGAGIKAAAGKMEIAKRLYQSAAKPTWGMVKKEGTEMIETGLKEGVPVSSEGLRMVEGRIDDLRKEISNGIQLRAMQGKTVDTSKVLSTLDDLEEFYKNTAAPEDALQTLKSIRDEFTAYHGTQIPVDKAQQIKINTYALLKKSYGEMKSAKIEGLKQVARGLKEEISSVFPEIANLNERQSKLLGLEDTLYRAVWRIENHQMMGIGSPLAATAGHALMGGPGAVVGFVGKLMLDDPTLKSKLAISLTRAGVPAAGRVVSARIAALKASMQEAASKLTESQPLPMPAQGQ